MWPHISTFYNFHEWQMTIREWQINISLLVQGNLWLLTRWNCHLDGGGVCTSACMDPDACPVRLSSIAAFSLFQPTVGEGFDWWRGREEQLLQCSWLHMCGCWCLLVVDGMAWTGAWICRSQPEVVSQGFLMFWAFWEYQQRFLSPSSRSLPTAIAVK